MNLNTLENLIILIGQISCIFLVLSFLDTTLRKRRYLFFSVILLLSYMVFYMLMNVVATLVLWVCLCLITYSFCGNLARSFFLPSVTFIFYIFSNYIVSIISSIISMAFSIRTSVVLSTLIFFLMAFIFKKWILTRSYKNEFILKIGAIISVATFLLYFSIIIMERFRPLEEFLDEAHDLFIIIYGMLSTAICFFFVFIKRAEYENREQRRQMDYLMEYSEQAEKNYLEILKFKHDYKNILISIEGYIETEDLSGLKEYFYDSIKATGTIFDQEIFKMSSIANIRIREIKSIVLSKLYMAHQQGITVRINVPNRVEKIPMPTIVLVRMLGIILDNAIEASNQLDNPEIEMAIISEEKSCTFILINNCSPDIPRLHDLKKPNFTTKPGNSGIGLANLDELVQRNENVYLDTKIDNDKFIQIITICEVEG